MTNHHLFATPFLGGGDIGLFLLMLWIVVAVLVVFGAWAITYNVYLTFSAPKQRSRKLIISMCVMSVAASLLLFVGSFIFHPDGNNYFLRFLALAAFTATIIGTVRAWLARRHAPQGI